MQQTVFDSIVKNIFGKQAGELASLLFEKKNVNEFLIAKKLGLTPNQARNILYKFSHLGFSSFLKKKDKRKGWYTYFWSIDIVKILSYVRRELEKEIQTLETQLKSRENKRFYICPSCKTEVNEETALLYDFACPECGNIYELSTVDKAGNELKGKIKGLGQQLGIVREELSKFEEEKAKKTEKERKKTEKEKEKERQKKIKARRKEKKKEKKAGKKQKVKKKRLKAKKRAKKGKPAKKKIKKKPKKKKEKKARKKIKIKKRAKKQEFVKKLFSFLTKKTR
jgi:transcription initiation factor TFIIE subunit alpha